MQVSSVHHLVVGPIHGWSGFMQRTPKSLLMRISQDGDRTAWPEFVTILVPAMTAWTRKLPVRLQDNDAEELIQNTLVELWRILPGFRYDENRSFRRLLQKMLHDRSIDLLRARYRHLGVSLDEVNDPGHVDFPTMEHEEVRTKLLHQILEIVRAEFSETTWRAFWEHCIQGRSPREIGEELSISPGTVYVAKQRVLAVLRARFREFLPD